MPKIKLVVWDLDNTLWNGTVYYKDKSSVQIKPGTKEALKELSKRGIKNAICSKNYFEDADAMLKKFEISGYFEENQIGWGLKSDGIKKIMEKFSIEPGETLFIDDDAFQRAEVESRIPSINTIGLADPIDVLAIEGLMPENSTAEDKERVALLKQQRDREEAEKKHAGDYKDFLRQCNIEMSLRFAKQEDLPRVCQLLNRTNELNTTCNRYSLEDLQKDFGSGKIQIMVAELTDKFGDYGLIAECVFECLGKEELSIRDLTVSCRTMGRGIGGALVIAALGYAEENGIKKVSGYLVETESNWRVMPMYEKRNFRQVKRHEGKIFYEFEIGKDTMKGYPEHLKVKKSF
ncbi:MAG TPA: HAD-IIIC family phosphatase [archaeon]|nr:HAD-IIIC family phosphatase [archaeon]